MSRSPRKVVRSISALAAWLALWPLAARGADDQKPTTPMRSTRSAAAPTARKSLHEKLQDINSRQQEILGKLDELLAELQHVKTRVTIR